MPLDSYLDQAVLMSRNVPGCAEVISCAKETVRKKFCNKRGRRKQPGVTPMAVKDAWVRSTREKMHGESPATTQLSVAPWQRGGQDKNGMNHGTII